MTKKLITFTLSAFLLAGLFAPLDALAHEHFQFEIGGEVYEFTVGSLNEPVVVDDKTGVYLNIIKVGEGQSDSSEGAVEGLEDSLKVELIAGEKSEVFDLEAAYGEAGTYEAAFYPTVATQLKYRVFGEINGTDFDYTFECNPEHPDKEELGGEVEVSEGVRLIERSGSYGCPQTKADLGFPEPSSSINDLSNAVDNVDDTAGTATTMGWIALAIGVVGLAIAVKK